MFNKILPYTLPFKINKLLLQVLCNWLWYQTLWIRNTQITTNNCYWIQMSTYASFGRVSISIYIAMTSLASFSKLVFSFFKLFIAFSCVVIHSPNNIKRQFYSRRMMDLCSSNERRYIYCWVETSSNLVKLLNN